jgi:hypothetical protein
MSASRLNHERRNGDNPRQRVTAQGSFKSDRSDPRSVPSPQPGPTSYHEHQARQFQSTSHKRSASGNPRPVSRTADASSAAGIGRRGGGEEREEIERRTEIRTTTERTYVTQLEALPRTRSPERKERELRRQDGKPRAAEARPKETKEVQPQGRFWCILVEYLERGMTDFDSSLEPRCYPPTTYLSAVSVPDIDTTFSITSSAGAAAETPWRSVTRGTRSCCCGGPIVCLYGL